MERIKGTVSETNRIKTVLDDIKINGILYPDWKCIVSKYGGSLKNLNVGDIIIFSSAFSSKDENKKTFYYNGAHPGIYINPHVDDENVEPKPDTIIPLPEATLEDLLLDDDRKDRIIAYYNDHTVFKPHIIRALKILNKADENRTTGYNIIKTTRAGYTTNSILASLFLNKTIMVVEPTNQIGLDTVSGAINRYLTITSDKKKIYRPILSNKLGCKRANELLKENKHLNNLSFIVSGRCKNCDYEPTDEDFPQILSEPSDNTCILKSMFFECKELEKNGKTYRPDVMSITYHKLISIYGNLSDRADLFRKLIAGAEVILMDEFGSYLAKSENKINLREKKTKFDKEDNVINVEEFNYEDAIEKIKTFGEEFPSIDYPMVEPIIEYFKREIACYIDEKEKTIRIKNPLSTSIYRNMIRDSYTDEPIVGKSMFEILGIYYWEHYEAYQEIMNENNKDDIKFILDFLLILLSDYIVISSFRNETNEQIEDKGKYFKTKIRSLILFPLSDSLIDNIEPFMKKNRIVLLSDATMPTFRFDKFKRDIHHIMFGDPAKTNSQMLIIDFEEWKFSNTRWFKNKFYKVKIVDKIIKIIKAHGGEKVEIWAPLKLRDKIIYMLKEKGINACRYDRQLPEYAAVNWWGSSGARGVESKRRVHIFIGVANTPLNAYDGLTFMHLDLFTILSEKDKNDFAKAHKKTPDEIMQIINKFTRPVAIMNDYLFYQQKADKTEREIIKHVSSMIRMSYVYANTWQPISRAKDPLGSDRSVVYAIGCGNDLNGVLRWGLNMDYVGSKKIILDQNTLIPGPTYCVGGVEDGKNWLAGGEIDQTYRFKSLSDIEFGVINETITLGETSTTSKHMWINIDPNIGVGCNTEDHRNGMFVAMIRCLKTNAFSIDETAPGEFTFTLGGKSEGMDIPKKDLVLKVLQTAYRINKKVIKVKDVRDNLNKTKDDEANKKIDTDDVKEVFKIIHKSELFKDSTWKFELYTYGGEERLKIMKG